MDGAGATAVRFAHGTRIGLAATGGPEVLQALRDSVAAAEERIDAEIAADIQ